MKIILQNSDETEEGMKESQVTQICRQHEYICSLLHS